MSLRFRPLPCPQKNWRAQSLKKTRAPDTKQLVEFKVWVGHSADPGPIAAKKSTPFRRTPLKEKNDSRKFGVRLRSQPDVRQRLAAEHTTEVPEKD
jgi:hypothetical protein